MKRRLIFLAAALALGLSGCTGQRVQEIQPEETGASTVYPTVEATVAPTGTAVSQPSESEVPAVPAESEPASPPPVQESGPTQEDDRPSDEEVLLAYRHAEEAFSWFDLKTLPADQDNQREADGVFYKRVTDERFPTLDSLRGYLKSLFSDEVVDELLPAGAGQYVDLDGALYVHESARESDITKGAVTLTVLWPEEKPPAACAVQAVVELLEWDEELTASTVVGQQIYSFPYQKVGDKWVFTHFESIF